MRVSINVRHHLGAPYETVRDAVLLAERLGFAGAYFPDHFLATELSPAAATGGGITARRDATPSDCWTLIALLALQTDRLRLGTLMSSATFRHPSALAISVAQLNRITGGRIDLGLGTNWMATEHETLGFAFPSQAERFELLEDQLRVIRTLWYEGATLPTGRYPLADPPLISGAADGSHARIIVGGIGLAKTPRLAASYADDVNTTTAGGFDRIPSFLAACDAACTAVGRDPSTLSRSVMLWICCGADDGEVAAKAAALGRENDALLAAGILPCTPTRLIDQLADLQSVGFDEVVLASRGPLDLEEIELIGSDVVPHVTDSSPARSTI